MDKKLLIAIIGAVAVIIAAIISIVPPLIQQSRSSPAVVPPSQLEQNLSKANIILSEVDRDQVREWLIDDGQYQAMAQSCLTVLASKRIINPIPFDVVVSKYRVSLGGAPDTNFPAAQYKDIDKVKEAIFKTWKERHKDSDLKSFNQIVENIK